MAAARSLLSPLLLALALAGTGGYPDTPAPEAEPRPAVRSFSPAQPKELFSFGGTSPAGFGQVSFVEQKRPRPALDLVRLPGGSYAMRLTANESCTGSWRVPLRLTQKTRYRVECEVLSEPGAEMGSQSLVVEHNLGGRALAPWVGTTNIAFEINSLGEDSGQLQYRLRGFRGTLVFTKVAVTQTGAEGAEPAPLYDRTVWRYHASLYRHAVPDRQPDDGYLAEWAVDPEATRSLSASLAVRSGAPASPAAPGFQLIYALTDQRLIPSAYPERLEEKGILAVTALHPPPGRLAAADERFYRVTLVKPFSWVPGEGAKTERGEPKVLLKRPAHLLHLYFRERAGLVSGYGLSAPPGPAVFYQDPSGKPVLPANDSLKALPLPCFRKALNACGEETFAGCGGGIPVDRLQSGPVVARAHAGLPLTGVTAWRYRARELERDLTLLGARQVSPETFPTGEILVLDASLRIGVTAKTGGMTPGFVRRLADAGATLLIGADLLSDGARAALERAPLWVCGLSPLPAVDEFDAYRSNFLSVRGYIDEPFERSVDWDEYVRKHEVGCWEDLARLFPQRIQAEARERRAGFPREPLNAFDTLPSMADLHFRAGVDAFWFEHYAPVRTAEELRRRTGVDGGMARANRALFAPMRGAAFRHGRRWGLGVWVTEPARNGCGGGQWEEARVTLLQAWREGAGDLIFYSESADATADALKWVARLRQELARGRREIPVGGHASRAISVMPGFLGGGKFGLGTYRALDTEENRRLGSAFDRQFAAFANSDQAFDVIADDAPPAVTGAYKEVWRLLDQAGAK